MTKELFFELKELYEELGKKLDMDEINIQEVYNHVDMMYKKLHPDGIPPLELILPSSKEAVTINIVRKSVNGIIPEGFVPFLEGLHENILKATYHDPCCDICLTCGTKRGETKCLKS